MVYDSSTSLEFQHQANAGQMLMVPQQMTPPMYRFPQQQPQQQYVYVQQPNATPIQGVTPIQTQFAAQPVTLLVTPVTPPAVPITPSNTEQNDETPPSSSVKNKSSSKKIKDKKKDNEMDKKAENNDVSKDSGESKDKSPLAQKLLDDDDNIVYLKMHSSLLARPEIQKFLSETQQNRTRQTPRPVPTIRANFQHSPPSLG